MSESPYHLEVRGFDEVWPVSTLRGREALSATYRFDAVFSVPGSFDSAGG